MEFIIQDQSKLSLAVKAFLPLLERCKIFLINGQMGVGKTTFVQELLTQMGVEQLEGSPTYSLINSYKTETFGKVYHLDLYRLKKLEEVYDIGLEELIDEDAYLFIEWPDLILSLIAEPYCEMNFLLQENNVRKLSLNFHE
jgi:tRNA threonylcarbamoyladenosine biosynthesis protein TsaE